MENQVTTSTESALKQFLSTLIDSKKLPTHIKTVEDAFTIAQMGKELGFPTMQAFHYIIPIQGKLSLSAKATGALLRKGGVKFYTKEDGVFVYPDGSVDNIAPKTDGTKPIDRRTTIVFVRDEMEESCSFTWKDAEGQGLTTKDNWKRMPREMLYARCIAKGANRIGADLLLGLYTAEEMADTFLKESDVRRNEDGTIAEVINITATEVK
jgi:hypothetical protein